jgi:hypothetical protein
MEILKKVKLNMTVDPSVKEYIINKSNIMGMSASAYITMLINQSKQQEQALGSIDLLKSMMAKMKDMEVKNISNDSRLTKKEFAEKYGDKGDKK